MKKNSFLYFIALWYAVYIVLTALVEPIGWFGGQTFMQELGIWPNLILLLAPVLAVIGYYVFRKRKERMYLGVTKFSTGVGRDEAFQNIRSQAKKKIFVVGIGMSNISKYGKNSIEKQARNVDIDFLMMDPVYLEKNTEFADLLERFLGIKNFANVVRTSFDELKEVCDRNNQKDTNRRLRLRVYNTIPTASMVMIDPDSQDGKCVVEFFLFRSGERRPRLECNHISNSEGLFDILKEKYIALWHQSKPVIE